MSKKIVWEVTLHPHSNDDSVFITSAVQKKEIFIDLFDSFKSLKTIHIETNYDKSYHKIDKYVVYYIQSFPVKMAMLERDERIPYSTTEDGNPVTDLSSVTWKVSIKDCDFGHTLIDILNDIYRNETIKCTSESTSISECGEDKQINTYHLLDSHIVNHFFEIGCANMSTKYITAIMNDISANQPLDIHAALVGLLENYNLVSIQGPTKSTRTDTMVYYTTITQIFNEVGSSAPVNIVTVSSANIDDSTSQTCTTYVIINNCIYNTSLFDYFASIIGLITNMYRDNIIFSSYNI